MYGETVVQEPRNQPRRGLSPHVRGNHLQRAFVVVAFGSIPACTGKPRATSVLGRGGWVYPRMYGETSGTVLEPNLVQGLSPHVRGNHWKPDMKLVTTRSIPACTGKPPSGVDAERMGEVYPRMYGETPDLARLC